MKDLFRRPGQRVIRPDEPISRGHINWDHRISEAVASQTSWKYATFLATAGLILSSAGNIYLANQSKVQTVHIVHDSIGGVIGVSASSERPGEPSQAMLMAAVQDWVVNVRTVYIDVLALRHAILAAYALVADKSQASQALNTFYQTQDPFERAKSETVSLQNVVAVPPSPTDVGKTQTWAVSWIETVTSRDGTSSQSTRWAANVTFELKTPKSVADAMRDPNGVYVVSFSWTGGGK